MAVGEEQKLPLKKKKKKKALLEAEHFQFGVLCSFPAAAFSSSGNIYFLLLLHEGLFSSLLFLSLLLHISLCFSGPCLFKPLQYVFCTSLCIMSLYLLLPRLWLIHSFLAIFHSGTEWLLPHRSIDRSISESSIRSSISLSRS